jgi:ABC-type multidrug transport system fused ATPase/permease subunit
MLRTSSVKVFPSFSSPSDEDNTVITSEYSKCQPSSSSVDENTQHKTDCPTSDLDIFGRFIDPTLQREYVIHSLKQKSLPFVFAKTMMVTGWAIIETIASLYYYNDTPNSSISADSNTIFACFSFLCIFLSLFFFFMLIIFPPANTSSSLSNRRYHSYFQLLFIISLNGIFICKLIKEIAYGGIQCVPEHYIDVFESVILRNNDQATVLAFLDGITVCPSRSSFLSVISCEMLVVMSFCPLILTAVFHEPRLYLVISCFITTGTLMLYSVSGSFFYALPILVIFFILIVLSVELHRQRMASFLTQRKLQQILTENEKNADKVHATEMRHMIGNVAHDLKTVRHFLPFSPV